MCASLIACRLAKFLREAVRIEGDQEKIRQELCELGEFSARSAFSALDTRQKGYLSYKDVLQFMRKNGFYPSVRDAVQWVASHSSTGLAKIDYADFEKAVSLADSLAQALFSCNPVNYKSGFSTKAEKHLALLIQSEIDNGLFLWRQKLADTPDFSPHLCFSLIDKNATGIITADDLYEFIKSSNASLKPESLHIFLRRFSSNSKSELSYNDFSRVLFTPQVVPAIVGTVSVGTPKVHTKKEGIDASEALLLTPSTVTGLTPEPKKAGLEPTSPVKNTEPVSLHELCPEFIHLLRTQSSCCIQLEKAKCALAVQADFNLLNAYNTLDPLYKGSFSHTTLYELLHQTGSLFSECDAYLFMQRCKETECGNMNYKGFCSLMIPSTHEFADLLVKRKLRSVSIDSVLYFSPRTQELLRQLLESHIEAERTRHEMVRELQKSIYFNVDETFAHFDAERKGWFVQEEVKWGIMRLD